MKIKMIQMGIALLSAAVLVASAVVFKEGIFREVFFYVFLAVGSTNILLMHEYSKRRRKQNCLKSVSQ